MNYYVYILECSDGKYYYGHTQDLKKRLWEHQQGHNKATKHRRPLKLIYYEVFATRSEAFRRERKFKCGRMKKTTKEKLIKGFLAKQNVNGQWFT